ncbi:MAG: CPBP family intramembrane metalloprotease [Clostridia bacterium]|nr:CPBP family intramembrane metalloprotease [Clostridia bacterium]
MSKRVKYVALAMLAAMVVFEYLPISYHADEVLSNIIKMTVTRGLGSLMFTIFVFDLGYRVHSFGKIGRKLLFALPCFAVVINNLPIIALITGSAYLTSPAWYMIWFALECIFIGIFEETAFRGAMFLILLEKRRASTKQIFWVTVASSAIFGCVHLLNLFAGAGIGPTLLQVGYSFLIGGMCAVVLLRTHNIWICAALHAIYDFCGFLLPTLGEGSWWDMPTVIITVALAVAVAVYIVIALLKTRPEHVEAIFRQKVQEDVENENV